MAREIGCKHREKYHQQLEAFGLPRAKAWQSFRITVISKLHRNQLLQPFGLASYPRGKQTFVS